MTTVLPPGGMTLFRRAELDYRTRETKLFEALRRRYLWDILKVFVAVLYPALRVYSYANGATLGNVAIVGPWLASAPWDTVGAAVLLVGFQWKNIRRFRSEILPRAERVAYEHGKRRNAMG